MDCEELSELDDDPPRINKSLSDVLASYESKDHLRHFSHYEVRTRLSEWGDEFSEPEPRRSKYDGSSTAWIATNSRNLSKLYAGQWILVDRDHVVGHSLKPSELQDLARKLGLYAPMIVKVSSPSKASSRTVYAGQVVRDNDPIR